MAVPTSVAPDRMLPRQERGLVRALCTQRSAAAERGAHANGSCSARSGDDVHKGLSSEMLPDISRLRSFNNIHVLLNPFLDCVLFVCLFFNLQGLILHLQLFLLGCPWLCSQSGHTVSACVAQNSSCLSPQSWECKCCCYSIHQVAYTPLSFLFYIVGIFAF